MNEITSKLKSLLSKGATYISSTDNATLTIKPIPEKWSKKEILGHLIDSGINNLQRFTEVQFEDLPYKVRKYNQDILVQANNYNHADKEEIVQLWLSINYRIVAVIEQLDDKQLAYAVDTGEGELKNLMFLIKDYVEHLEHHLNQIIK